MAFQDMPEDCLSAMQKSALKKMDMQHRTAAAKAVDQVLQAKLSQLKRVRKESRRERRER